MDKVFEHVVEWYDGDNGPFRQGYDAAEPAQAHAEIVGGTYIDNTEAANAAKATHQEAVDADAKAKADADAQAAADAAKGK